jgi:cytoskeletal protein CcmA (bactofilin family)
MPEEKPKDDKPAEQPAAPATPTAPTEAETLDITAEQKPAAGQTPATTPSKDKKGGPLAAVRKIVNIYTVVFALLVVAAIAVVMVSIKPAKTQNQTQLGKLTDSQLAQLKSNSTLVGDPKQTLDIQSSTIFEGQVLARSDLSIAGSLKVGGALSLPSITIAGSGNFAQVGVSGALSVGGDTNLQGQLTVQKNLNVTGSASFGSLSVSSLSITSLQVKNDFTISKHIITSGGTPGRSFGTALGGGGTASVSGTDTAGTVNINTGGSPPAGLFVTVTFTQRFATTPHVVITPVGSASGSLQYYVNRDASGFSIGVSSPPPASSNFAFDYIVIQ